MCSKICRWNRVLWGFSIFAVALSSCVKEEYDLNKEFDGTAVLMKDITMPVGNLEKITVESILSTGAEDQMIVTDENGNYAFTFDGGDPFSAKFSIPYFQIPFEDGSKGDEHYIVFNAGPHAGSNGADINQEFELKDQRVEKVIKVTDEDLLPYQILDIKEITINTLLSYDLSVSYGAMSLKKDFMMDFPDWIEIEKNDSHSFYVVENQDENKNVIRFTQNAKIVAGTPLNLSLKITKVNLPDGSVIPGGYDSEGRPCKKIHFEETEENMVIVSGVLLVNTNDFAVIPEKTNFIMNMTFNDFYVESALVSLDMSMTAPDQEVPISSYPSFFDQDGLVLDLYDAFLKFNVKNELPVALDLNADFKVFKNSEEKMNVHLGGNVADAEEFTIPALWEGTKVYSRLGQGEGEIALPELGNLINYRPDRISVSDIVITGSREYVTITSGQELDCSLGYELYAPLAFGKDLSMSYDIDIEDIGLDLTEYGVNTAGISLDVINSIPLKFNVVATAFDEGGNPVEGINLNVTGEVAPGSQLSPSSNKLKIQLTAEGEGLMLNSLKLNLIATSPDAEYQGVPLNKAQCLEVKNLALNLPEGLVVDLENLFGEEPVE